LKLDDIFSGPRVTMEEVLQCRTARDKRQKELLTRGGQCLVSFSMNIPGDMKQFPLAKSAFEVGMEELQNMLPPGCILDSFLSHACTGSEGMLLLNCPSEKVKHTAIELEEYHPLGRLFDIDVLSPDGLPLSRTSFGFPSRSCLICGQDAKICARSQAHSLEAVRQKVAQILENFFRDRAANRFASYATRALLYEVSITPKPGLVDRVNNGSHHDMDYFTFLDSCSALCQWFRQMFCQGWESSNLQPQQLFDRLRYLGRQAEKDMFTATGGVNTHKGLIFSMGILCAALGEVYVEQGGRIPLEKVLSACQSLGQCSLKDFQDAGNNTAGLRCYHQNHLTGVRGEAAAGFPTVLTVGLPTLQHWLSQGLSLNDAAAITLVAFLATITDTNMIHRSSVEKAALCKAQARELLSHLTRENYRAQLESLDAQYIRENLSPGGCADLLALTLMIYFLFC